MVKKIKALSFEEHQQIIYDIVYTIDDFCKRHKIQFFLYGGSLLGAIRHNGIIPWDDDADVALVREEYDRFIRIFAENGPEGYQLLSDETTPGYHLPIAKIIKKNTYYIHNRVNDMDMGIWVDLLPIDGCPGSLKEAQKYFIKKHKLLATYVFYNYRGWKRALLTQLKSACTIPFKAEKRYEIYKTLVEQIKSHRVSQTDFAACVVNGLYGKGEVQNCRFYKTLTTHTFGDRELPIPTNWEKYLKDIYGDYMQLPPLEKREIHTKEPAYLIEATSC